MQLGRRGPVLAAMALVFVVAFPITSLQDHAHWSGVGWIPFLSPPIKAVDIIGNVLLTMPAGFTMVAAGASASAVVIAVGALSLVCEWAQVYSHGRFPSATDFVCNVAGAAVGAAAFAYRRQRSATR